MTKIPPGRPGEIPEHEKELEKHRRGLEDVARQVLQLANDLKDRKPQQSPQIDTHTLVQGLTQAFTEALKGVFTHPGMVTPMPPQPIVQTPQISPAVPAPSVPDYGKSYPSSERSPESLEVSRLQRAVLDHLDMLRFDPRKKISPENPRHLEGLLYRFNQPKKRLTFFDELFEAFPLRGEKLQTPEWIVQSRHEESFAAAVKTCHDPEELRRFCDFLLELRHQAVMSRFDMNLIGPREVSLKEKPEDFIVMHKDRLREQRQKDLQTICERLEIDDISEIGAFDAPNGLYSFLVNHGVVSGNPTFTETHCDVVSANIRVLLRAIEEDLIAPKERRSKKQRLLVYYKRRPSYEYAHMEEDYACLTKGSQEWRLTPERLKWLTKKK